MKNFGFIVWGFYFVFIDSTKASWGTPESSQYHIQTDEGPERYFKYQTDNGQYRKEKRLQDGTVIGTDAWIDAFGYLRQKDYIADNKGYRILKSKTIFVGTNVPIQVAMKVAKNKPGDDPHTPPPNIFRTQPAIGVVNTTPKPIAASPTPSVYVRPHSQPNDNYVPPRRRFFSTTTLRPDILVHSSTYDPILSNDISSTPIVIYSPSTTPSSVKDESHLPPIVVYNDGQQSDFDSYQKRVVPIEPLSNDLLPPRRRYDVIPLPSTTAKPIIIESTTQKPYYNGQSLFNRDLIEPPQNYYKPNFRDRMDTDKYQEYDGVSLTNNGFKYFLPRQYHEEDNSGGSNRVGSYGYIDPFGIRRVTYYNAGPNGFEHRKNNRYVGFNATPYDPRPV